MAENIGTRIYWALSAVGAAARTNAMRATLERMKAVVER